MIKANEIRIGNLLYEYGIDYDQGENKFIDSTDPNIIAVTAEIIMAISKEDSALYGSIPITPEILKQCGFFWGQNGFTNNVSIGMNYLRDGSGRYDGCIVSFRMGTIFKYKYLHEIQNLYFALTVKELEFKQLA